MRKRKAESENLGMNSDFTRWRDQLRPISACARLSICVYTSQCVHGYLSTVWPFPAFGLLRGAARGDEGGDVEQGEDAQGDGVRSNNCGVCSPDSINSIPREMRIRMRRNGEGCRCFALQRQRGGEREDVMPVPVLDEKVGAASPCAFKCVFFV
jgi:hypothetical protein